jgi:hypothetical protein
MLSALPLNCSKIANSNGIKSSSSSCECLRDMYGKTKPVFHSAQPNQTIMGFLFNLPRAASVMKASTGVTVTASNHNNHTFLVRGNRIATARTDRPPGMVCSTGPRRSLL